MQPILWISAGAILGANARYWIGIWAANRLGLDFPYGTLLVNTSGSFILGFLVGASLGRFNLAPEMRLFLGVGFLGSYTTFSTFSVETVTLIQHGQFWQGVLNIGSNNILGWIGALLGIYVARLLYTPA